MCIQVGSVAVERVKRNHLDERRRGQQGAADAHVPAEELLRGLREILKARPEVTAQLKRHYQMFKGRGLSKMGA